jgi:hypothetical protein
MMNTREKKEGPDGIKLWNLCFPMIKDFDQTSAIVKELTDLKIGDPAKITLMVNRWISCAKASGGIIDDAMVIWKLEVSKMENLH